MALAVVCLLVDNYVARALPGSVGVVGMTVFGACLPSGMGVHDVCGFRQPLLALTLLQYS